jgi:Ca-activated chloride channel family protein
VGYLLDEIRLRGENKELKDEVTTLARKYGIVTPYTAYLIIEDEQRRGVPVAQRTLRNFEADREVLEQTRKQFEALKLDKAGDQAIGSARAAKALKEATNAKAAANNSNREAQQANFGFTNGAPSVPTVSGSAGQLFFADTKSASTRAVSQPMEFAAGKNFTRNARFWVDSNVQAAEVAKAKRSRIAFNSDAYFNLLAMEPKVAQWLALGRNVQFVLNNTIYEIYEETKNADN